MSDSLQSPAYSGLLYRLGWEPNPLEYPDWRYIGNGRYDDPERKYRVLYFAQQRLACFLETLDQFSPDLHQLALEQELVDSDEAEPHPPDPVPNSWLNQHMMGRAKLSSGQRWLDLRKLTTRRALRTQFAVQLDRAGLKDLDAVAVSGPYRELTQAISRWAYGHGYQGLAFPSRVEPRYSNWAVFEGASFERVGNPTYISRRDRTLRKALAIYGLALEKPE